jgi:hypothetical protein
MARTNLGVLSRGLSLFAAVAGLALFVGCAPDSSTCASETPNVSGEVNGASCSGVGTGATVEITVPICPTTCQTDPSCGVDVNEQSGFVQLDPVVHTCDTTDCSSQACTTVTCTFTAPTVPNTYHLYVIDASATQLTATLDVVDSGTVTSCSL